MTTTHQDEIAEGTVPAGQTEGRKAEKGFHDEFFLSIVITLQSYHDILSYISLLSI